MANDGNGGFRAPPHYPMMVPVQVPTGRYHYTHEFETVRDRQTNQGPIQGGGRARSYSTGIYDPRTDTRTNRVHQHVAPDNTVVAQHPRGDEAHRTETVNRGNWVGYQPETMTHWIPFPPRW